jgi:DnaD/phage-associated family protein
MAEYLWNSTALRGVFMLPDGVADNCLTLATAEQLRVLIWFSRHHQQWDAAACAAQTGLSADECEGCLRFWVQQGILTDGETLPASVTAAPQARPAAVKPQIKEVLQYQKNHPHFSTLVEAASARLGKPIGHSDTATLLYLHNTVGLPMEVILMEIAYAVSIGKGSMHYVEKIALEWYDNDISTVSAVDEHIRYLDACRQAARAVEKLLDMPREMNINQSKMAEKWLTQWGFGNDMLLKAADITREKVKNLDGRFLSYMDKILEQWQADGIDRPDKIPARTPAKKKGAAATNPEESSLDFDEFEKDLLRYRPKFKAPEKK